MMTPMLRRISIGQVALVGALLLGVMLTSSPAPAAPRLTAGLPDALTRAEGVLKNALAALAEAPSPGALKRAVEAMEHIERVLDTFFHAPNLKTARPEARALRPVVLRLRAEDGLLVQVDDVLHFKPAVHAQLAAACTALGDAPGALRHHLDLLAVAPTPEHIALALKAAEAAHDGATVAALRARLAEKP